MASVLKVDKLDPQSGTALEIGTSGDTVTVPSGVGLTLTDSTLLLPTTITSTTEVKTNKVSPATGTAFALGDSGDTFTVPSGATIVNSGTATGFGITTASLRPNVQPLIINGDMAVAQRSTSEAGLTGLGYQTVDRYGGAASSLGTWTQSQDTSVPTGGGFAKSLKMDCTTADASPGAGDYIYIDYAIEAQDLQFLKYGSSDAETITVAFWVKAYQTGVMQLTLYDWDNDKLISASYEIDSSATWEKKILTFAGNTSDNFDVNNAKGLSLWFPLDTGSNYEGGALRSSWTAYSASDFNPAGAVNVGDNTNNYWQITGLQLEVGEYTSSTIPPFQHESWGDNLIRCQRYYQLQDAANGAYAQATYVTFVWQYPVTMRAIPSGAATSPLKVTNNVDADYVQASANITMYTGRVSTGGALAQGIFPTLATPVGRPYNMIPVEGGSIAQSAEL